MFDFIKFSYSSCCLHWSVSYQCLALKTCISCFINFVSNLPPFVSMQSYVFLLCFGLMRIKLILGALHCHLTTLVEISRCLNRILCWLPHTREFIHKHGFKSKSTKTGKSEVVSLDYQSNFDWNETSQRGPSGAPEK